MQPQPGIEDVSQTLLYSVFAFHVHVADGCWPVWDTCYLVETQDRDTCGFFILEKSAYPWTLSVY